MVEKVPIYRAGEEVVFESRFQPGRSASGDRWQKKTTTSPHRICRISHQNRLLQAFDKAWLMVGWGCSSNREKVLKQETHHPLYISRRLSFSP